MYRITNGRIITPNDILEGFDLLIQDGRIEDIIETRRGAHFNGQPINAHGGYIIPGFIDIHSDYIEHIAAPRPTSMMDFRLSLHEAERELITHGVTTMFHSLSLYLSDIFDTKPIRKPQNVRKLVEIISGTHGQEHLVRHRFHARYEIDNLEMVEEVKQYILNKKIHMISFMDHTPGQGQFRDLEIFRKFMKGYRSMSDREVDNMVATLQSSEKMTLKAVRELAELATANGLAVASHDDDSIEKIDLVKSFGTTISEFPITLEVARYAKEKGMFTAAGAPNVLKGGSHSGNLSAAEAVKQGSINILCSDYYPAALLHSVFLLNEKYDLPLTETLKLVTLNPAKAVNMADELGSLEAGKRADVLIVERLEDEFPAVTTAFVDGHKVFTTHYRRSE